MHGDDPRPARELDAAAARTWIGMAVGVLLLAGIFALLLVIGRMPPFDRLFSDPGLFRRGLVVHVALALVTWFYCFLVGLWFLLPSKGTGARACHRAHLLAGSGIAAMVVGAAAPTATPVLSNYIPVLDHPVFLAGLAAFFVGAGVALSDRRLHPNYEARFGAIPLPPAARPGLRAAAMLFLIALFTFALSFSTTPSTLPTETFYEVGFWGGGHVLQVASVAGMLVVWLMLLSSALGTPPLGRRAAAALFGLLLAPMLAAPFLAMQGTTTGAYRAGFTLLMRWGIFPVVTIFFVACVRGLWRAHAESRLPAKGLADPRLLGFYVSAGLTVLGFVLGALIRGSNTMVPAHYHASIGAVTAAFMAGTWLVLAPLGLTLRTARQRWAAGWQPVVFGVGQMVFAAGFGFAGAHGMARKTYGTEQQIRSTAEYVGLGVMGIGGLLAVAGGVLYLVLVIKAWRGERLVEPRLPLEPSGRTEWRTPA